MLGTYVDDVISHTALLFETDISLSTPVTASMAPDAKRSSPSQVIGLCLTGGTQISHSLVNHKDLKIDVQDSGTSRHANNCKHDQ